jgi:hypothetical protein
LSGSTCIKRRRAQYEANLARRRFMQVDPDNRLVADTLEAEWNEKLRHLQDANDYYETHRRLESEKLKKAQQKEVLQLAKDFPRLWKNPRTPVREKKRMIRFLIEDVTMIRAEDITLHIRFKGGAAKTLNLPLPLKGWQYNLTDPKIVEIVDELLSDHSYSEIANSLCIDKSDTVYVAGFSSSSTFPTTSGTYDTTYNGGNVDGFVSRLDNDLSMTDEDGDGISDDDDNCPLNPNPDQEDSDGDGVGDACDNCHNDPNKTDSGVCGCGIADTDSDGDGIYDCNDTCNYNGICKPPENCITCPEDCIGKNKGKPNKRYCCGDEVCEGEENSFNCAVDCGPPPECGDGACEDPENSCSCPDDCGTPPPTETNCADGIDNDCDGEVDCNDVIDCLGDPACDCKTKGELCSNNEECCSNNCRGKKCK